jgi:transposase
MFTEAVCPEEGLDIAATERTADQVVVQLRSRHRTAPCPQCGTVSSSVHSSYTRTLADVPVSGLPALLRVRVHRFRCRHPDCPRHVFADLHPGLTRRCARSTEAHRAALQRIGTASGALPGVRLARSLGINTSPTTLRRRIAEQAMPPVGPVRVLGIDDWAWRKGRRYGTVLVDLERGRIVDLLPDRTSESVARWLAEHPGVQTVCRDRAGAYADGIRQGAPDARQVADRWHLLKNLADALERVLAREHRAIRAAAQAQDAPPLPGLAPSLKNRRSQDREGRRGMRLARYDEVRRLFRQGASVTQVAVALGLSRPTVRKFLNAGGFPERAARPRGPSKLDPFAPYLRRRWGEGCHNGRQLWREIKERGFDGGMTIVGGFLSASRWSGPLADAAPGEAGKYGRGNTVVPSPKAAAWLLLKADEIRGDEIRGDEKDGQKRFVERLCALCPKIEKARELTLAFFALVRERRPDALESWMTEALGSGMPDLRSFVGGLARDKAAVVAGLSCEWSNGPTEGHVNRLKAVKRQMYGRAGFEMLRRRVILGSGP